MLINDNSYFQILEGVKEQIHTAQYKAVLGANKELIILYWNIGNVIIANSQWGNKFVDNLARDIKLEFPNIKGFSVRNLKYMKKFAEIVLDFEIVQTLSAQLSWSHNVYHYNKTKTYSEYIWYVAGTIKNGWSLSSLEFYVEKKSYQRQMPDNQATNFELTLSEPQSKLAIETLKSPYIFDFVEKREGMIEREIEAEMVKNITKTIMELGTGFAFVGEQYRLTVSETDYYIDLLFYHLNLRCYVVIELKAGKFKPEYAGKLNFYLSAVDDMLKHETDNPSIGIMLCKERDRLTAEYALKDINKPIGVSEYKLSDYLPEELADTIPSAEDIEKRIKMKYQLE
ncbi:MAG: PDDEXK nuclease domain-containing protein [Oscillospiraceae bacterium]|jgi:predicted nuclease of restriction endonuclease-like (RecB) superfamily|nr:PDDEXK nuclease domain-containing protein [Oscillospiraceae bacterium]